MMSASRTVKESDKAVLASLGYKEEFKRTFKPLEIFGVSFSIIGVIPSLAPVLSSSLSNGGAVSMVWGWTFASAFILCIGIALGELASSAPTSGWLYYLTFKFSPPRYRNILCWIVGYSNTICMVTGTAATNWACTVQIAVAASINSGGQFVMTNQQSYGLYAAICLFQAIICSFGSRLLARLQTLYIICNVLLCLVIIFALPIATPAELRNPASYVFGNFTNLSVWPDPFAFIMGLLSPNWTIGGYDAVMHISEESSNAATSGAWGMVSAIVVAAVLGWVINVVLAFCMGPSLSNVLNSSVNQPLAQICLSSFGQRWTVALWSLLILVQLMMGSSVVLVASRQSFAFARDGALPFSKYLYRINKRTGTPVNTVWFNCILALLVGLFALLSSTAINAAFTIAVASAYVGYIVPISARFLSKNNFKPGPFSVGRLGGPIAAIAVVYMVFILTIFCFPSTPSPDAATMNYTPIVFGGVMLLAITCYYFPVYGGVNWFQGPTPNVEVVASSNESMGNGLDEEKILGVTVECVKVEDELEAM